MRKFTFTQTLYSSMSLDDGFLRLTSGFSFGLSVWVSTNEFQCNLVPKELQLTEPCNPLSRLIDSGRMLRFTAIRQELFPLEYRRVANRTTQSMRHMIHE